MTVAPDSPDLDRSLQTRRVLLAPVCLCLVAGLHVWRVTTTGQTPWKGGSFGMFSTIDSEYARFVQAYLITDNGPLPIAIPSELDKKIAELRAAPNQVQLQEVADRLAARIWFDPAAAQQRLAEQLKQQTNTPLTAERLRTLRNATTMSDVSFSSKGKLVAAKKDDRVAAPIPFTAVRIDLFKFEMPPRTSNLQPKRQLTATAERQETQP